MVQKSKIWRFSGVLRVFALVMASLYLFVGVMMWAAVFLGKTEHVFTFIDIKSTAPLEPWQIILGIAFTSVLIGAYIVICLAANQFLKASKRQGFFIQEVITACRKLGYGLLLYWFGLVLKENFMPGVLTFNFPEDSRRVLYWIPTAHYVVLLAGVILLLMSQAMQEAREIDSDNKQII